MGTVPVERLIASGSSAKGDVDPEIGMIYSIGSCLIVFFNRINLKTESGSSFWPSSTALLIMVGPQQWKRLHFLIRS